MKSTTWPARPVLNVDHSKKLGAELSSVRLFDRPSQPPEIDLRMTASGADQLAKLSAKNIGRRFTIIFDGEVLAAPSIRDRISTSAVIRGDSHSSRRARSPRRSTPRPNTPVPTPARHLGSSAGWCAKRRRGCRRIPRSIRHHRTSPKLRVLKDVLLDESAVESAQAVAGRKGEALIALYLGYRDDVVLAAMGDKMLDDVLGLLSGTSGKTGLADDQRYKNAFAQLPPAEDEMVFFDLQGMLKPIANLIESVAELEARDSTEDVVLNSTRSGKSWDLCKQAWDAYEDEDYEKGLALTTQAYEIAPDDSRVLYYLACFHALNDDTDKAIDFLEQAVDGGFYCPKHISRDPDLRSLHSTERYQAALQKSRLDGQQAQRRRGPALGRPRALHPAPDHGRRQCISRLHGRCNVATDGYSTVSDSVAVLVP